MDALRDKRPHRGVGQREAYGGEDAAAGGRWHRVFREAARSRHVRAGVQSLVGPGVRENPVPVQGEDEGKEPSLSRLQPVTMTPNWVC